MVQYVKNCKHYLMGKETITHTNHQSLHYLQAQSKLQQTRHYKSMGFLQQFHLVIKYKKGTTKKLVDMLSRLSTLNITAFGNLMHIDPFTHDAYREAYSEDQDFKEVYQELQSHLYATKLTYNL